MDDKLKIFWNLDVLVKMARSKNDGPSLRIEEQEINNKIKSYTQEINEINSISEEEIYDTSAEMADRNIEIITKKQLQTLKNDLKEKNKELNKLKEEEKNLYNQSSLLRDNLNSQEKYLLNMQERIAEITESDVIEHYNKLIEDTSNYISELNEKLKEQNTTYDEVQDKIIEYTNVISQLEEKIEKKKKILAETQAALENKDNYIDKTKKEKNQKRISELESKKQSLSLRLEEIRNDPKYLESKIKEIINNNEDLSKTHPYLTNLLNQIIRIPYINVPANNALEEELLKATRARDSFANQIEQKTYNILEIETPEKVRIDFLNKRIISWNTELDELKEKIALIDKDSQYDYNSKGKKISEMINTMKNDLEEFQKAYNDTPETNISQKSRLKASIDEKQEDIIEAEKIATSFKKDEADDIKNATLIFKYECENLKDKIKAAESEIKVIKNRLTSKKSGLIDITSKNKDKEVLRKLAQIVIDIKHRRQFPETPIDIIHRLEESLGLDLIKDLDKDYIKESSNIKSIDYNQYLQEDNSQSIDRLEEDGSIEQNTKRGIKVVAESPITIPEKINDEIKITEENNKAEAIEEEKKEDNSKEETTPIENSEVIVDSLETPTEVEEIETQQNDEMEEPNDEKIKNIPDDQLSIDNVFNPEKKYEELQNEKSNETNEYINQELDQYINDLDKEEK